MDKHCFTFDHEYPRITIILDGFTRLVNRYVDEIRKKKREVFNCLDRNCRLLTGKFLFLYGITVDFTMH